MRMRLLLVGLALAVAAAAQPAAAQRAQLGQRDAVTIDPQRAYILYRTPERMDVRFLRDVDEAELAAWRAERAEALQRAQRRHERALANWERDGFQCRGRNAASAFCRSRGPRPEPVTDENFAFTPPELDNFVDMSRGRYFERGDGGFTYLRAVDPGSYVLYGQILANGQAVLGYCLCMGSVRFEARAGQIVDLGELRLVPDAEAPGPREGRFDADGRLPSPAVVPARSGAPLPARLAGLPVAPAALHAADRMPNYFGILIDRLAPIPGVLAYDRGRVIDLAAGEGADRAAR